MTSKRLREQVRQITDSSSSPLRFGEISTLIRDEKPSTLAMMIRDMVRKQELVRDDAPRKGTGSRYLYRSGPVPVSFSYHLCGRGQKVKTGFMSLARLEKKNPAEWARLTKGGTL